METPNSCQWTTVRQRPRGNELGAKQPVARCPKYICHAMDGLPLKVSLSGPNIAAIPGPPCCVRSHPQVCKLRSPSQRLKINMSNSLEVGFQDKTVVL